jgi:hypothetical protein
MILARMTWKEKRIVAEENNDMVADGNSENNRDAPTDIDVDQGE